MNKGELRTHFKALLNRSDCSNALADTFIDQSIARIQRTLRIPPMERQQVYTILNDQPQDYIILPADFLEVMDIYYDGLCLTRKPLRDMVSLRSNGEQGSPIYFAREQGSILLHPTPSSGTIYLNYYGQFDDLVADTDENDLSVIAPDAAVYGALAFASDYFIDERGMLFEQKFTTFLSELQTQANEAETAGTVQAITPMASYQD